MPTSELHRSDDSWVHLLVPPAEAHGVQFYEEDDALCDSVARYLAAGLEAGESAIAIVTPAHAREIRVRLRRLGSGGEHATYLDARTALAGFMVGPMPDAERFERTIGRLVAAQAGTGNGKVRAFGEMVDILWRDGNSAAAIRLEELWDDLAHRHGFSLLCAYLMDDFLKEPGGEIFRAICRHHPHVFGPDGQPWVEPPSGSDSGSGSGSGEVAELRERTVALEAELAHRKRLELALRDALGDLRRSEQALRESRQDLEELVEHAAAGRCRCILRDLSDRRQLERELYDLFMQAPAPICVIRGPDLVFDMANDRYAQILGRTGEAEELVGKVLGDAIPGLEGQGIEELLREVMRSGRSVVRSEAPIRLHRDGVDETTFWTFTFAPLRDRTMKVDRVMVLANEVTDEVAARRAIEEARGALEASLGDRERLIDQLTSNVRFSEMFVGILGHDLRNPLMAIGTAASLLERRNDSGRCTKPIGRIQSSARRMSRMIDQILDFTRVRIGGGFPLQCRPLDLPTVCRGVLDELELIDDGAHVDLEVIGDVRGSWDEDRLCQLVSNLAGNALQHRVPGSCVRVWLDGSDPAEVLIRFVNAGCIPAALLPTLFEPFHGRRDLKAPRSSGLGLGLFTSQQIARAHGGTILVESGPEEGTRFTVALPRHVEEGALHAAPERSCRP